MKTESLKEFRIKKNISQKDMANVLEISLSYLSKIESGFQSPSYSFLVKLKKKYPDCCIDSMFF